MRTTTAKGDIDFKFLLFFSISNDLILIYFITLICGECRLNILRFAGKLQYHWRM
jgi:hypothetical protein